MVISLNSQNFDQEVFKANKPVLVIFYQPNCSPCEKMDPIFKQIAHEFSSDYKFAKLDVSVEKNLATKYKIGSVPAVLFVSNGKILGTETGYMEKAELLNKIHIFCKK